MPAPPRRGRAARRLAGSGARRSERGRQVAAPRPEHRAEAREVTRVLLAVDQLEAPARELPRQHHERDLRRVRLAREHRLAEEDAAERDAVEPADEPVAQERLRRMRKAEPMQLAIGIRMSGVIQVPPAPGRSISAQRGSPRRMRCRGAPRSGRAAASWPESAARAGRAGRSTARGSGECQRIGWPSEYHGKMPDA